MKMSRNRNWLFSPQPAPDALSPTIPMEEPTRPSSRWILGGLFLLISSLLVLFLSVSQIQGQATNPMTWTTTSTTEPPVEEENITVTLNLPSAPAAEVVAHLEYSLDGESPQSLPFLNNPPDQLSFAMGVETAMLTIPTQADGIINLPDTFFVSVRNITQTGTDDFSPPEPLELTLHNSDTATVTLQGLTGSFVTENPTSASEFQTIRFTLVLDKTVESDVEIDWSFEPTTTGVGDETDYVTTGDNPLVFPANTPAYCLDPFVTTTTTSSTSSTTTTSTVPTRFLTPACHPQQTILFKAVDDSIAENNEFFRFVFDSVNIVDPQIPDSTITEVGPQMIGISASDQRPDTPTDLRKLHSCEIDTIPDSSPAEDGLKCWGANQYGQLGDGTTNDRYTPVFVHNPDNTGLLSGVTDYTTGYHHTCAVAGGNAYCWGRNSTFQLGNPNSQPLLRPTMVEGGLTGKTVTQMAAGVHHTCALVEDDMQNADDMYCWGYGADGQLGEEGTSIHQREPRPAPTETSRTGGITNIVAGAYHTCIEHPTSGVRCFGRNDSGQLGNGNTSNIQLESANWLSGLSGVSAGYEHTCAIATGGAIHCWGANTHGQAGSGTIGTNVLAPTAAQQLNASNTNEPIAGAQAVSAGHNHTCIITSGDDISCWGANDYGQLGVATLHDGTAALPTPYTSVNTGQIAVNPDTEVFTGIQANTYHTCAWTATSRQCWGLNTFGSIGAGYYRPYTPTPTQITGIAGASAVTGGANHTCVVSGSNNTISCLGNNEIGQLGRTDRISSVTPIEPKVTRTTPSTVVSISHATAISAGPDGNHTCAISSNAPTSTTTSTPSTTIPDIVCWGDNQYRQASPNINTSKPGIGDAVIAPTSFNWTTRDRYADISAGNEHTCVLVLLDADKQVRCWGQNDTRQIGVKEITSTHEYDFTSILRGDDSSSYGLLGDVVRTPKIRNDVRRAVNGKVGSSDNPSSVVAGAFATCMITDEIGFTPRYTGEGVDRRTVTTQLGKNPQTLLPEHGAVVDPLGDGVAEEVLCWGDTMLDLDNNQASTGDMVQIRDRSPFDDNCLPRNNYCTRIGANAPVNVPATVLTDIESVEMGSKHTCAVQHTTGNVFCWGNNDYGQLAYDLSGVSSRFAQKVLMFDGERDPDDSTFLANVGQLSTGQYHTCALIDNTGQDNHGDVYCWGKNDYNQLGNARVKNPWFDRAVQVGLPRAATQIGGGGNHTCAVLEGDSAANPAIAAGEVYCWGYHGWGQFGGTSNISGYGDTGPTAAFEFDIDGETFTFNRSVNQRVQLPEIVGGSTDNLSYEVVADDGTEYTFPEGIDFEWRELSIVGTPEYGSAAIVNLKYRALAGTTLVSEVSFMLDIDGSPVGAPIVGSPISSGYTDDNDFFLFTAANQTETFDLTTVFNDGQNTVYCTDTVTTACLDFAATSDDTTVATAAIDAASNVLTITSGSTKGEAEITVTATDADMNTTNDRFLVKYNTAPTLATDHLTAIPETIYIYLRGSTKIFASEVFADAESDDLEITYNSETIPTIDRYEGPIGSRQTGGTSLTIGPAQSTGGPYDLELCATDSGGSNQQVCVESEIMVVDPLSVAWDLPSGEDQLTSIEFTAGQEASIRLPDPVGGAGDVTYTAVTMIPDGFTFDAATKTISSATTTAAATATEVTIRVLDSLALGQHAEIDIPVPKTSKSSALQPIETETISNCSALAGCQELTFMLSALDQVTDFSFASSQSHIMVKAGETLSGITLPEATKTGGTVSYCLSSESNCPGTFDNGIVEHGGLTFDLSTREVTGSPTTEIDSTVMVLYANDSTDTIALPFSFQVVVNNTPVILNDSLIVHTTDTTSTAYDFTAAANLSDPDGDTHICTITEVTPDNTDNVVFTANGTEPCNPSFGPGTAGYGTDTFTVEITDGIATVSTTFTVFNNTAPTVSTPIPDRNSQSISAGGYTVDLANHLTDADSGATGEMLTYSVRSTTPEDINTILANSMLTVTPPTSAQPYTITACLTDAAGEQDCDTFNIIWVTNTAPTVLLDQPGQTQLTVATGGRLEINFNQAQYVVDPDSGDTLTCEVTRANPPSDSTTNVEFTDTDTDFNDSSRCSIVFTSNTVGGWGSDTFNLAVSDGNGGADDADFTVYHNNSPEAADTSGMIPAIGRKFAAGNYTVDLNTLFNDDDISPGGDSLTFTLGEKEPNTATIERTPNTDTLVFTAPNEMATHRINVCATDTVGEEFCDWVTVSWATNNVPDIKIDDLNQNVRVVTSSRNLVYDLTDSQYVEDVDGDTVTCNSITPVSPATPPHVSADLTDCDLTFSAGDGGYGRAEFTLEVFDGTATVTATIVVFQNSAPMFTPGTLADTERYIPQGNHEVDLNALFRDTDIDSDPAVIDDDSLTFTLTESTKDPTDADITLDTTDMTTLVFVPPTAAAVHSINVCATDIAGEQACGDVEVDWLENSLPEFKFDDLAASRLAIAAEGETIVFDLTDSDYVEDADGHIIRDCMLDPADTNDDDHISGSITGCTITFTAGNGGFGSADFDITVSDGIETTETTITVWQSAAPRLIGATSGTFDETIVIKTSDDPLDIDLTARFVDSDQPDDTLDFTTEMPSTGLTHELVAPDNNMLRITPPAVGSPGTGSIRVCATDDASLDICGTFNFVFADNAAPTLETGVTTPFTVTVIHGKTAELSVTDFYEDSDNPDSDLIWILTPLTGTPPDNSDTAIATAAVDSTDMGLLTITGVAEGSTVYHLAGSDGINPAVNERLEITVGPNAAPTQITGTTLTIEVGEGGSRTVDVSEFFEDSDTPEDLVWGTVTSISSHATLPDTDTNIATVAVNATDSTILDVAGVAMGMTNFHVTVSDGINTLDPQVINVDVVTNSAPTIKTGIIFPLTISLVHGTTDNTLDVDNHYEDSDTGDTLAWRVSPITADPAANPPEPGSDTNIATVTVDDTDDSLLVINGIAAGTTAYHIFTTDGKVDTDPQRLEITVTNATPTREATNTGMLIPDTVSAGKGYSLEVTDYYEDADNDDADLIWVLTEINETDTNVATAVVDTDDMGTLDIQTLNQGTTEYDLAVSDGTNTTVTQRLVINVDPPNNIPTLIAGVADPLPIMLIQGKNRVLSVSEYYEDLDDDDTLSWMVSMIAADPAANPPELGSDEAIATAIVDTNDNSLLNIVGVGAGETVYHIAATDGEDPSLNLRLVITVAANTAPTLKTDPVPDTEIEVGEGSRPLNINDYFEDTDTPEDLVWVVTPILGDAILDDTDETIATAVVNIDNGMHLDITGLVIGGTTAYHIAATDGISTTDNTVLTIEVVANNTPALIDTMLDSIERTLRFIDDDQTLDITEFFADDDTEDVLSWIVNEVAATPTEDGTDTDVATATADSTDSGMLIIDAIAAGTSVYHLSASDGKVHTDPIRLVITITNETPTLKLGVTTPITETVGMGGGRPLAISDFFEDAETPNDLVWGVTQIVGDASLDDSDPTIATAVVNMDNNMHLDITGLTTGTTSYYVTASDGVNTTDNIVLTIEVVANNTPTLIGTANTEPSFSHSSSETLDITDFYEDMDMGDTLSWVITEVVSTPTEDGTNTAVATATIHSTDSSMLVIDTMAAGISVYHIAASDGKVHTTPIRLVITVTNETPVLEGSVTEPETISLVRGGTQSISIDDYFTDADDDDTQLSWILTRTDQTDTTKATVEINASNAGQIDISALAAGDTEYLVSASDGVNTSATLRIVITVTNPPSTGGGVPPGGGVPGGGTPPTTPPPAGDNRFADDDGNTHEANINLLAEMGISRGCNPPENTEFCPDRAVTRGEMATFMVRAFTLADTTDNLFGDDNGTTHEANINRLATAGITRGCNPPANTNYCPFRPVTRAQMATFLARALDLPDGSGNFTDTDSSVHSSDINRIAAVGITRGCNPPTNSRYCPDRAVTRAEMATFLIRATDLLAS